MRDRIGEDRREKVERVQTRSEECETGKKIKGWNTEGDDGK